MENPTKTGKTREMNVLIVGAGAVGLVYGKHLQAGGATVSFLIKPKHRAQAEAGYALNPRGINVHYSDVFLREDLMDVAAARRLLRAVVV